MGVGQKIVMGVIGLRGIGEVDGFVFFGFELASHSKLETQNPKLTPLSISSIFSNFQAKKPVFKGNVKENKTLTHLLRHI
jgi:hypothetical protein